MKRLLSRTFQILSRHGWNATLIALGLLAAGFTWSSSDELYNHIRLFDRAALTISSSYVEELDNADLIKAGIDGMISKLDQHSRFLVGADYLYMKQETDGEFEGIGISLALHHDTLTVESTIEGSPANQKGVRPGDRIIAVDGINAIEMEPSDVKMRLRGPSGTLVVMKVHRPDYGTIDFSLIREKVEVKAIPFWGMISDEIGYIRLSRFSEGSSKEMHIAIRELLKDDMGSLILDLRGNSGGLLLESVKIASMFLPENASIVDTRTRGNVVSNSYSSSGEDDFQEGELVVVVDSQTASAAEIVAGAIQDHDRGIIVGSSTFGKGLVQQIMQFTDDAALKLTTAKYFLPSGRCLQKPDWSLSRSSAANSSDSPDSLYRTDSGRVVFGGGGILPDIYIDEGEISPFVEALIRNSCFFDYSLEYAKRHQVGQTFQVTDSVMTDFERFVKSTGLEFRSDDRGSFDQFKSKITLAGDSLRYAISLLDREIARKEKWQFDSNYSEIAARLREAVVLQAGGDPALYREIVIPTQPQIAEAVRVLSDNFRYNSILATH